MKDTWTQKTMLGVGGLMALVALVSVMPRGIAADTATVNVSAIVVGNCKFLSGATLDFGNLDPAVGTDANATTSLQFWCTKNATYTITDNDGANKSGTTHRLKHASLTEYIPYTYCYSTSGAVTPCNTDTASVTGNGQGRTSPITLYISGTILGTDYINASAGSYSDTVTMTINP